ARSVTLEAITSHPVGATGATPQTIDVHDLGNGLVAQEIRTLAVLVDELEERHQLEVKITACSHLTEFLEIAVQDIGVNSVDDLMCEQRFSLIADVGAKLEELGDGAEGHLNSCNG